MSDRVKSFEDKIFSDRCQMLITGISLRFATYLFRSWLEEKDIGSVIKSLKTAQLDSRLLVSMLYVLLYATLIRLPQNIWYMS